MEESKYKDITDKFISAATQVHKIYGSGFNEGYYIYLLQKEGNLSFRYLRDVLMPIYHGDTKIGTQRLHFYIEDAVAVELKVIPKLEEVHISEAIRNLEAFNIEVGLLVNFGGESLEYKRLVNTKYKPRN